MSSKAPDQFSDQEAQRRFEKLLRAAVNTAPAPLKDKPKKRAAKAKAKEPATKRAPRR